MKKWFLFLFLIFIPFDENFSTEFSYTAEERERVLEDIRANPDQHDILAEMGKMLKSIQIADSVFSEDDLLDYAEKNIELLVQRKYTRDIRSAIFQTYVYSLGSQKAIKFLARYVSDERVAESDAETLIYLSIFNGGPLLLGKNSELAKYTLASLSVPGIPIKSEFKTMVEYNSAWKEWANMQLKESGVERASFDSEKSKANAIGTWNESGRSTPLKGQKLTSSIIFVAILTMLLVLYMKKSRNHSGG